MGKKSVETEATLAHARRIARKYDGNLTVRQLYYQLVAQGHIPNAENSYKRIVSLLTDARMEGKFPLEWLVDRRRSVDLGSFTSFSYDVDDALDTAAEDLRKAPEYNLRADRWIGQTTHVSVWVEKEALVGVFEGPCKRAGVSWMACCGYPSVSLLSEWLDGVKEAIEVNEEIEQVVVLYFGDHDPDGWEIPRSAERNLAKLARVKRAAALGDEGERCSCCHRMVRDLDNTIDYLCYECNDDDHDGDDCNMVELEDAQGNVMGRPIIFERIGLLMPQIRALNPPPFPAKQTSSRYPGYVEEHKVTDAWELDALPIETLTALIERSIDAFFDQDIRNEVRAKVAVARGEMMERMKAPGWVESILSEVE